MWNVAAGVPAVATDFVHGTHIKSIKYPASAQLATAAGVLSDAGSRASAYFYFNAFPANPNSSFIMGSYNAGISAFPWILNITTGGVLRLFNSASTQIGSNGPTLSLGTWYRISVAYTITSTSVNRFEVFVNGVSAISVTNATLGTIITSRLFFANISDASLDMRTSDHYADNVSSLADTGNVWVTAKRPFANGTLNEFTTQVGVGGSGYGSGHTPQVNERPISSTNGWSISTTTKKTEEYTIESRSQGDIDITGATIVDFAGWMYASVDSTADSPVHNIIVAGVATAKTMTTNPAVYIQVAGSTTYPAGNTDIGMDGQYTTNAHVTRLLECGIMVAYLPTTTYTMAATPASFTYTAQTSGSHRVLTLVATPTSYLMTGISAGLHKALVMAALPASYVVTGGSVIFTYIQRAINKYFGKDY